MEQTKYQTTALDEPQPPVYSENTVEGQSPPDYDTIFGKLKKAKENSSNPVEFASSATSILCGSVLTTVGLIISCAVPIISIVIGVLRKNDCPIEKYIPLWLIVSGACGTFTALVKALTNLASMFRKRKDGEEESQSFPLTCLNCIASLVGLFCFAWFIAGNVWVYSNYKKVDFIDTTSKLYCDRLCYLFSFWIITITWIMFGLICCCGCGILLCIGCGVGFAASICK